MQAEASGARRPGGAGRMLTQPGQLVPGLPGVGRLEQGGVFDARIDRVGIVGRWFEVPDTLECPRPRRTVVKQVGTGLSLVHELVADRLPGLAAVIRPLDELAEPPGRLRQVDAVLVDG